MEEEIFESAPMTVNNFYAKTNVLITIMKTIITITTNNNKSNYDNKYAFVSQMQVRLCKHLTLCKKAIYMQASHTMQKSYGTVT
jgi:hypothetical protein